MSSDIAACGLFVYHDDVVAVDLIGAGIPLTLSLAFALFLLIRGGLRVDARRLVVFSAMTVGLGAMVAAEYIVWDAFNGGISVPTWLVLYSVILPVGFALFLLLGRGPRPRLYLLQTYVVGTFGVALSDLLRTFSGLLNVSPQIIGAAQFQDGVFLGGPLLVVGYVIGAMVYALVRRRTHA